MNILIMILESTVDDIEYKRHTNGFLFLVPSHKLILPSHLSPSLKSELLDFSLVSIMDSKRKTLLVFGFIREICSDNDTDFIPGDITRLFVIWLCFGDRFDEESSIFSISLFHFRQNSMHLIGQCY